MNSGSRYNARDLGIGPKWAAKDADRNGKEIGRDRIRKRCY